MKSSVEKTEIRSFIADSAIEAVAQIRDELGSDAVVLEIRQIKPSGISRLFKKPKIEVLAYKPAPDNDEDSTLLEVRRELSNIKALIEEKVLAAEKESSKFSNYNELLNDCSSSNNQDYFGRKDWRIDFLKRLGIEDGYARIIIEDIFADEPSQPSPAPMETRRLIEQLKKYFRGSQDSEIKNGVHIFIGPPGSGKTTFLCKLLARLSLVEARQASVIQMDAVRANTSELPSLYSEILGVPFCRNYISDIEYENGCIFVDVPGVDWQNKIEINKLFEVLSEFKNPHIHLVLNLCYETRLLLAQTRAFGKFEISDLVFTHLDEIGVAGKIYNLLLGTNYTVSYLSGGQNIPGEIYSGSFEAVFKRLFTVE